MDYFWQGGIQNLDREMAVYELLQAAEESAGGADADVLMET